MKINNNPIRGIEKGDGSNLFIKSIFYTLQGEGDFAGYPAIFLRLGGCNLQCYFCDTDYENFQSMTLEEILFNIKKINDKCKFIVITGGEPFRQPIQKLCQLLLDNDYKVQIETNGILYQKLDKNVHIICSPKASETKYYQINKNLLPDINSFKFIISKHSSIYNKVPDLGQNQYNIPVYVQPMDEQDSKKNSENLQFTTNLALKNSYRLSLQIHKIVDIE